MATPIWLANVIIKSICLFPKASGFLLAKTINPDSWSFIIIGTDAHDPMLPYSHSEFLLAFDLDFLGRLVILGERIQNIFS